MKPCKISPWLINYIKKRGGNLYVTLRMSVAGWWSAYKCPTGLIGKPDDLKCFDEFVNEDVHLFIDKDVLSQYSRNHLLLINIEGYGRYRFEYKDC